MSKRTPDPDFWLDDDNNLMLQTVINFGHIERIDADDLPECCREDFARTLAEYRENVVAATVEEMGVREYVGG